MFSHGFRSFASITVIAACLLIMGSFALVGINIDSIIRDMERESQILAFVDESLTQDDARLLEGAIRTLSNVREVKFITREEALENYKAQYEDTSLFDDIDASVLRNRYVWIAGVVIFFVNGCMTGMGSFIPTALVADRGFTESAAGTAGAFLMAGNLLGSLITPTISLKTGKFRLVLILCGLVAGLGCCFAWRLPGIWLYVGLVIAGYTFGSGMAQTLSLSVRLPGVGPALAGTAGGLISTLDLLGAKLMPAYVASTIANGNRSIFFMILGIFAIPWMIGVALLPKSLDVKG